MESLAIKYRPKTFEDVVEQGITTKILSKTVDRGIPKNAYLFYGDSGCGKTTLARIFANKLNKGDGNPIEIDAASNSGVDQVRAIVNESKKRALIGMYKIYIIDECHAISNAGWQAFLKGIEEPSPYTIFIFCTTEPNKVPETILNRVQKLKITKISSQGIKNRLEYVCTQEKYTNFSDTCDLISKLCQGCMRDALTTLEQCAELSTDLSLANTKDILGKAPFERMMVLTNLLLEKQSDIIIKSINKISLEGVDLKAFLDNYLEFMIDLQLYNYTKNIDLTSIPKYLENSPVAVNSVSRLVSRPDIEKTLAFITDNLLDLKAMIKNDNSYKATIEAYLLKISRGL